MPNDPSFAPTASVISRSRVKTAIAVLLIAGSGLAFAGGAVINGSDAVRISFTEKGGGPNGAYELPAGEGVHNLGQILFDRTGNRGKADVVMQNLVFNVRNLEFYGEGKIQQQNVKLCLAESNENTPTPGISDCITITEGDGASQFLPQMRNGRELRGRYQMMLNFIGELAISPRAEKRLSLLAIVEPAEYGVQSFRFNSDKRNTDIAARVMGEQGMLFGVAKVKGALRGNLNIAAPEQGEGAIEVSRSKEDGPTNIIAGGQQQFLGGFKVKVTGEGVNIEKFDLRANIKGKALGWSEFTNITLVELTDNGGMNVLAGPMNATTTATEGTLVRFTDPIALPVGFTDIVVRGDVSQYTSSGDAITLYTIPVIDIFANGAVSSENISARPLYEIESYTRTVKTASLGVSAMKQPFAQSVIAGADQFTFANYLLDASDSSEDVRVLALPLEYHFSGDPSDVSQCSLYNGDIEITTGPNRVDPVGKLTTGDDFTFTIDKGQVLVTKGKQKIITLKCDVSKSAKEGTTLSWGIDGGLDLANHNVAIGAESGAAVNNVSFSDSDGQTMTVSEHGSYTVQDSYSPQVLLMASADGNSGGDLFGVFRFEAAASEGVEVKQIALELAATEANSPSDLVGQRVSLWHDGVQVGTAQFGQSNADSATSTLTTPVRVEAGESEVIEVRGDLAPHTNNSPIGAFGAIIAVKYDGDNNGLQGNYGLGILSGSTIEGTSPDTSGSFGARVFRAVPVVQDVTTATTLAAGSNLYQIEIRANGGRDIGLHKLSFGVRENGASVTDFQLFGPTTGAVNNVPINAVEHDGEKIVEIVFDDNNVDRIIPAGTTKTYSLRVSTITGLTASGTETLQVRLLADKALHSTPNLPSRMLTVADFAGEPSNVDNFIWTPFSTTTPATGVEINYRPDWTNGYGALGFSSLGEDMPVRVFSH